MAAASGVSLAAHRRLVPLLFMVLAVLVLVPTPGHSAGARACTYTVKVKTSCSRASPSRTRDAVSLAFGDAYRNEAHAPRLLPGGTANGAALGRCATDTFRVAGPCGYGVCYLYLRRSGPDGWAPEWVQVVQPGPEPVTATFYFGDPLPDGVWYGHNRCPKAKDDAAAAADGSSADDNKTTTEDARGGAGNSSSASTTSIHG